MNDRSMQRLAQAQWAVQAWDDFPVARTPRPIVLAGGEVIVGKGFRSGAAQDAFGVGFLDWQVDVPAGVRESVQRAATLKPAEPPSQPVKITHAGRETFSFQTDRGPRSLPAWWIHGPALLEPVRVLDPIVECWRPDVQAGGMPPTAPTQIHPLWSPIEIDADGRGISFNWLHEAPPGETICMRRLRGRPSSPSKRPRPRRPCRWRSSPSPSPPSPARHYTLQGVFHHMTAWLRQPLGARVFVGLHGKAIAVIPARER